MTLKLHDADDIRAALQGIAASFEAGRRDTDLIAYQAGTTSSYARGYHDALEAVGLVLDAGDWRRDEPRD